MEDKNGLAKLGNEVPATVSPKKFGVSGLHARVTAQPKTPNAAEMRYRLGVMLDVSGSMGGEKINRLKEAMQGLCSSCNFLVDTSMALRTFPHRDSSLVQLTTVEQLILGKVLALEAGGGTPMSQAMLTMFGEEPLTRGILMSDGHPDYVTNCYDEAMRYQQAEIPIDCVHIGDSDSGADVLKRIAELTGGKYIKFTDMSSFGANFKFLAPAFRGMLESGSPEDVAKMLGAKEVK